MVKNKNAYSSGESLAELLVAVLIISLAMIMLFSGAKVGTEVMNKSRAQYEEYYTKVNDYEEAQAAYAVEYYKHADPPMPEPTPFAFSDMRPHKHNW